MNELDCDYIKIMLELIYEKQKDIELKLISIELKQLEVQIELTDRIYGVENCLSSRLP